MKVGEQVTMLKELSWTDALLIDGIEEDRKEKRAAMQKLQQSIQGLDTRVAGLSRSLDYFKAQQSIQGFDTRVAAQTLEFALSLQRAEARAARQERAAERMIELERLIQSAVDRAAEQILELHQAVRDIERRTAEQAEVQQSSLRLVEMRAEHAAEQVAELQRSRWRRIGLRLGLARKASFEN